MSRIVEPRKLSHKLSIVIVMFFYLVAYFNLVVSFTMNSGHEDKNKLAEAYVKAYQERDIQKLAALYYRKNSKEYKNFIQENYNIFEERKNDAMDHSQRVETHILWYNKKEICDRLVIWYKKPAMPEAISVSFPVYFTRRFGKLYFSRLIDGWTDPYGGIGYPPQGSQKLSIDDKNIIQIDIKENEYIDHETFRGLKKLVKVSFPKKYYRIDPEWFAEVPNLEAVEVHPENELFTSKDGIVYTKDMKEIVYYPKGKIQAEGHPMGEFTLPDSVKIIGEKAFFHNTGLKKITLKSVQTIENRAFYRAERIREVIFNKGIKTIRSEAFVGCVSLEKANFPDSLKTIEDRAFMECTKISQIYISSISSLSKIGWAAFERCEKLQQIYLPDGIEQIDNWTFDKCFNLQEIRLPAQLQRIGVYAFRDCQKLKSLKIAKTVTTIDKGAFYNCKSLSLTIDHTQKPKGWKEGWDAELLKSYEW